MLPRLSWLVPIILLAACNALPNMLTVSAASNLQPVFTELGAAFEKQTGTRIALNFGATRSLAQQIAQGAPVDVFAAADRASMDDLVSRGFVLRDSAQVYAIGRIVIYARENTAPIQSLLDLTNPAIQRIAIANPSRAPYGLAAREALQAVNVWSAVESKMILAENIQQAQQYADNGSVDVAITALSLAMGAQGKWAFVPSNLHAPIEQALGIVKNSPNEKSARAFVAFVMSVQGHAVLKKHGYE